MHRQAARVFYTLKVVADNRWSLLPGSTIHRLLTQLLRGDHWGFFVLPSTRIPVSVSCYSWTLFYIRARGLTLATGVGLLAVGVFALFSRSIHQFIWLLSCPLDSPKESGARLLTIVIIRHGARSHRGINPLTAGHEYIRFFIFYY